MLLADLIRQLEMPLGWRSFRPAAIARPIRPAIAQTRMPSILPKLKDRDVLVIDDIFDTGHTLVEVLAQILRHEPTSLRSAVLMRKIGHPEVPIQPDDRHVRYSG